MAAATQTRPEKRVTKEEQNIILLIGRSGSGKSCIAKKITANLRVPVKVLNDRTNDKSISRVTWEEIPELRSCALIAEDVISATASEFKKLQNLCNFQNSHQQVIYKI